MKPRQPPIPSLWMFTDERQGEDLWGALAKLPRGAGVVFRHKRGTAAQRRALFERVYRIARRRRLLLILSGSEHEARRWGADGAHCRTPSPPRFGTAPAHDLREIRAAERSGAAAIFLSPLYKTRSHPGAPSLGPMRFAALARATRLPVIALGGMTPANGAAAMRIGAAGWAGIDAWSSRSARIVAHRQALQHAA